MTTLKNAKIAVGALGPGMAVLTRSVNARWAAPEGGDMPKHGLDTRKHVFGLALASNVDTRELEMWTYILISPDMKMAQPFSDGCWCLGKYTPEMWADLTKRQRIP